VGAVTGTQIELAADMRYDGQGYDVTVPLETAWLTSGDFARTRAAFHAAHRATYGHANESAEIWLKELRAHIIGATPKPRIIPLRHEAAASTAETRTVRLFGREVSASVHERATLGVGQRLAGPAIVNQMDTTTWIPPGWGAHVVPSGALVLEKVLDRRDRGG
jgi:N-methylhydantoinase A